MLVRMQEFWVKSGDANSSDGRPSPPFNAQSKWLLPVPSGRSSSEEDCDSEGKRERIAKSLSALNQPPSIRLTSRNWRAPMCGSPVCAELDKTTGGWGVPSLIWSYLSHNETH